MLTRPTAVGHLGQSQKQASYTIEWIVWQKNELGQFIAMSIYFCLQHD